MWSLTKRLSQQASSLQVYVYSVAHHDTKPPSLPPPTHSDDFRMLVSPACGAALAAVYGGVISELQKAGKLPQTMSNVVVVVCGGNEVSLELIQSWKETFNVVV